MIINFLVRKFYFELLTIKMKKLYYIQELVEFNEFKYNQIYIDFNNLIEQIFIENSNYEDINIEMVEAIENILECFTKIKDIIISFVEDNISKILQNYYHDN